MRKFNVGDVVTFKKPQTIYTPGPYVVDRVFTKNDDPAVYVTRLDGSLVYYTLSSGQYPHQWILQTELRLEPFLDAARKAVTDAAQSR
jgi:hypothetical protein